MPANLSSFWCIIFHLCAGEAFRLLTRLWQDIGARSFRCLSCAVQCCVWVCQESSDQKKRQIFNKIVLHVQLYLGTIMTGTKTVCLSHCQKSDRDSSVQSVMIYRLKGIFTRHEWFKSRCSIEICIEICIAPFYFGLSAVFSRSSTWNPTVYCSIGLLVSHHTR